MKYVFLVLCGLFLVSCASSEELTVGSAKSNEEDQYVLRPYLTPKEERAQRAYRAPHERPNVGLSKYKER